MVKAIFYAKILPNTKNLGLIDKIHDDTSLKAWYHIALSRIFMKNKKYVLTVS